MRAPGRMYFPWVIVELLSPACIVFYCLLFVRRSLMHSCRGGRQLRTLVEGFVNGVMQSIRLVVPRIWTVGGYNRKKQHSMQRQIYRS